MSELTQCLDTDLHRPKAAGLHAAFILVRGLLHDFPKHEAMIVAGCARFALDNKSVAEGA